MTVHREQSMKREDQEGATIRSLLLTSVTTCFGHHYAHLQENKIQQLDVYYQLLSQHVSGIIMPIFRRTKTVLLHVVYCAGSAGCGW